MVFIGKCSLIEGEIHRNLLYLSFVWFGLFFFFFKEGWGVCLINTMVFHLNGGEEKILPLGLWD